MRHMVVPAVHLVLQRGDQILLSQRHNTGYEDGNYSLPSGHIEATETALSAVLRESREEIGLDLTMSDIHPVHVVHRFQISSQHSEPDYRVDWFFQATAWTGEPYNGEPEKCRELRWADPTDLPPNTIPYIRACLEHISAGTAFSEFGW